MDTYLEIVLRGLIAIVYLFIIAKALGAKQISHLNFYDYIVGITIGSIAAALCIDTTINIVYSLIAMTIFALSDLVMSFFSRKTIWGRRFFNGSPIILIDKGTILYNGLKKAQLNVNDLLRELREKDYFNIADIEYAIYETNGKLSILPKDFKRPVVAEDINAVKETPHIYCNIIIDKKIIKDNLSAMNKDENWLYKQLKKQNMNLEDVLLATLNEKGELSLYNRDNIKMKRTVFQ